MCTLRTMIGVGAFQRPWTAPSRSALQAAGFHETFLAGWWRSVRMHGAPWWQYGSPGRLGGAPRQVLTRRHLTLSFLGTTRAVALHRSKKATQQERLLLLLAVTAWLLVTGTAGLQAKPAL